MAAVKANDQRRMGDLWGSERGPASSWMKSDDLKQRLAVFQIYLNHVGSARIPAPWCSPSRWSAPRAAAGS